MVIVIILLLRNSKGVAIGSGHQTLSIRLPKVLVDGFKF